MSYSNINSHNQTPDILIEDVHSDDENEFVINDDEIQPDAFDNTTTNNNNDPPPRYIPEPQQQVNLADGVRLEQRRFAGGDTLDESVVTTLMRDVRAVGTRLRQVVWTFKDEETGNQEWDLWGPLVFCLMISTTMSMIAPESQKSAVFSGVFALIWLGQLVVTLNVKLLGGTISFFHALCVSGYSLFPIVPASLFASFVSMKIIRVVVDAILVGWAIFSATRGLKNSGVLPSRVFIATYPVALFFVALGWLCVIT